MTCCVWYLAARAIWRQPLEAEAPRLPVVVAHDFRGVFEGDPAGLTPHRNNAQAVEGDLDSSVAVFMASRVAEGLAGAAKDGHVERAMMLELRVHGLLLLYRSSGSARARGKFCAKLASAGPREFTPAETSSHPRVLQAEQSTGLRGERQQWRGWWAGR